MKMERKIYGNIAIISIVIALVITVFLSYNFYNFFIEREKHALKDHAIFISKNIDKQDIKNIKSSNKYRLSLIDKDGNVKVDNYEDIGKLDNHKDRPEINQALKNGKSEISRYSKTLSKDSYYYSILMDNEDILRVSVDLDNLLSIFLKIMPISFLVIILILIFLLYISSLYTKKIIDPVDQLSSQLSSLIAGEEHSQIEIYDELMPFVNTISYQSIELNKKVQEVKNKNNLIENMISNMNEGLILLNEDRDIVLLNDSSVKLLNREPKDDYLDRNFIELSRDIDLNKKIIEVGQNKKEELVVLELEDKILDIHISPVENSEDLQGILIFILDRTMEKKAEKLRREFSANISHELKGPLTSINGYAELIKEDMVDYEDIQDMGRIIHQEGKRLLDLIDDVIKLSQIDEAKLDDDFEKIKLNDLVEASIKKLDNIYLDKDIKYEVDRDLGEIYANKNMVEELLYNIIENAIKHSKCKVLKITSRGHMDELRLIVKDDGIGISKLDQERIFERFYTVDSSRRKSSGNTGLGLAIAKHIMEYHDGSIELISALNRGSSLIMTFPKMIV